MFGDSCVVNEVLEPEGESDHSNRTGNEAQNDGHIRVRRKPGDHDHTNHDEDDRGADPDDTLSPAGLKTRRGPGKSLALELDFLELEARSGKSRIIEDEFTPVGRNPFTGDVATETAPGSRIRSGVSAAMRARMQTEDPDTLEQLIVPTSGYADKKPGTTHENEDKDSKPKREYGTIRPHVLPDRGWRRWGPVRIHEDFQGRLIQSIP